MFFPSLDLHLYTSESSRLLQTNNDNATIDNLNSTLNYTNSNGTNQTSNSSQYSNASSDSYSYQQNQNGEVSLDNHLVIPPKEEDQINCSSIEEYLLQTSTLMANLRHLTLKGSADLQSREE